MTEGVCQLCKTNQLLVDAHIIPKWMYIGILNKDYKSLIVNLAGEGYPKRSPSGLYDPNILCRNCDNSILSPLEKYGQRILCNPDGTFIDFFNHPSIIQSGGLRLVKLKDINYTTFKLFLLSLIWRMHITKIPFFKPVDLGSYAEELRSALLGTRYVPEDQFEVAILGINDAPELITRLICNPKRIKQGGNTYYITLINGFFFMFNISPRDKLPLIVKSRLRESGHLTIPLLEDNLATVFYDSTFGPHKVRNKG